MVPQVTIYYRLVVCMKGILIKCLVATEENHGLLVIRVYGPNSDAYG